MRSWLSILMILFLVLCGCQNTDHTSLEASLRSLGFENSAAFPKVYESSAPFSAHNVDAARITIDLKQNQFIFQDTSDDWDEVIIDYGELMVYFKRNGTVYVYDTATATMLNENKTMNLIGQKYYDAFEHFCDEENLNFTPVAIQKDQT